MLMRWNMVIKRSSLRLINKSNIPLRDVVIDRLFGRLVSRSAVEVYCRQNYRFAAFENADEN